MPSTPKIVPSAARELLYRLTESLEIPFTLTDREGVVVASTAGQPTGQVDPFAMAVALRGTIVAITEADLRVPPHLAISSPAAEHAGLFPPAPGVYAPIRMNGGTAAVLFARGDPEAVRTKTSSAAAAAGLALEFASGAHSSITETLGPDLALRALLRGTQREARRATLTARVAGWDLLAPRVALVIGPTGATAHLTQAAFPVIRDLLHALSPNSPLGQMSSAEWVALPALPRLEAQLSVDAIAQEIEKTLTGLGLPVIIGIGETHIDLPILPGLRRSYREASFAASWARRLGASPGVHTLRSLGPLGFLAPGVQTRQQFARQLLEPLARFPDILETIRIFLDSNLSIEAAAKRSGQHRHTVRSHLQRAHELTGLDPRELGAALQFKLAFLLGDPVRIVQ